MGPVMLKTSLALLALPLVACVDSGPDTGAAGFALTADGATAPVVDDSGTSFTLASGHLDVRRIELDLPAGLTCADVAGVLVGATCEPAEAGDDTPEDKIRISGPFDVDLVAGTATPSLAGVVIPAASYTRVDLRVQAFTSSFTRATAPTTLDLAFDFSEDIRIEQPGGIAIAPGDDLIARFATANWLAGADLAGCLDRGACTGIEDIVRTNMKDSGDLVSHEGHDD